MENNQNGKNNKTTRFFIGVFLVIFTVIVFMSCSSKSSVDEGNIDETIVETVEENKKDEIESELDGNNDLNSFKSEETNIESKIAEEKFEENNSVEIKVSEDESDLEEKTDEIIESESEENEHADSEVKPEIITEEIEEYGMSDLQRNSINMLNYITFLTEEINTSRTNRIFLESAYSSIKDNSYPNVIDDRTLSQMTSIMDTLNAYRMIDVKRAHLDYLYEQNMAQAMRERIPNPVGLLSAIESGNLLKTAASVIYMAADSSANYKAACSQAEMQYIEADLELDKEEQQALHDSNVSTFTYMVKVVNDNDLPGDLALRENSIEKFVSWSDETNLTSKIKWFESNENTYKEFRTYWLELAKSYYQAEDYPKCLNAIEKYESMATRIFIKDYDFAQTLPMAIIAAKQSLKEDDYVIYAVKYCDFIDKNSDGDDWSLRYFIARTYMDLYACTNDIVYLEEAYRITSDTVNELVGEQEKLNEKYLNDIQLKDEEVGMTKREKKELKDYNKLIKEERKVELPPVSEAFYLNCELLFTLADELNISQEEEKRMEEIIHDNGNAIFLTNALDSRFWFSKTNQNSNIENPNIEFDGKKIVIPACYISERSKIKVIISDDVVIDDWIVKEVKRPKESDNCSEFMVSLKSKAGADYKYKDGDKIVICITPVVETPEETIDFSYNVKETKTLGLIKQIEFERVP